MSPDLRTNLLNPAQLFPRPLLAFGGSVLALAGAAPAGANAFTNERAAIVPQYAETQDGAQREAVATPTIINFGAAALSQSLLNKSVDQYIVRKELPGSCEPSTGELRPLTSTAEAQDKKCDTVDTAPTLKDPSGIPKPTRLAAEKFPKVYEDGIDDPVGGKRAIKIFKKCKAELVVNEHGGINKTHVSKNKYGKITLKYVTKKGKKHAKVEVKLAPGRRLCKDARFAYTDNGGLYFIPKSFVKKKSWTSPVSVSDERTPAVVHIGVN